MKYAESMKAKIVIEGCKNVVYRINYVDCGKFFIGKTNMNIKMRIDQS